MATNLQGQTVSAQQVWYSAAPWVQPSTDTIQWRDQNTFIHPTQYSWPLIGSGARNKRRRLRAEETSVLLQVFEQNPKPDAATRAQLARTLSMTPRAIQIWFQNRRAKIKRDLQEAMVNIHMPQQILGPHSWGYFLEQSPLSE